MVFAANSADRRGTIGGSGRVVEDHTRMQPHAMAMNNAGQALQEAGAIAIIPVDRLALIIAILFHEYFDGDNGRGVGGSHQTGWTGLVAKLLQPRSATG